MAEEKIRGVEVDVGGGLVFTPDTPDGRLVEAVLLGALVERMEAESALYVDSLTASMLRRLLNRRVRELSAAIRKDLTEAEGGGA